MDIEELEQSLKSTRFVLFFVILFALVVIVALVMHGKRLSGATEELAIDLDRKDVEIQQLKAELEKSKHEKAMLLQDKSPGLNEIAWGAPSNLTTKFVDSVIFTFSQKGDSKAYQYLMTLKNDTSARQQPKLTVLLFDSNGVQIGHSAVNSENGANRVVLDADEIRPFSAQIDLTRNEEPKYFLVEYSE